MKKTIAFILACVLCMGQTCVVMPDPQPNAPDQSDISNWDFTPCMESWESYETCKNLLLSNQEIITGGYTFLDILFLNVENQLTDDNLER